MPRSRRALAAFAVLLCACACSKASSSDQPETSVSSAAPAMPEVHFTGSDGKDHFVTVEVVRKEEELRRGLMYRRHLDPDAGMLFMMGEESVHTFWMHNTYIPLDMIFIGKDMTVAGVVANATPQTDDTRSVDKPSFYVLEVNSGWAAANTVGAGAKVTYSHINQ